MLVDTSVPQCKDVQISCRCGMHAGKHRGALALMYISMGLLKGKNRSSKNWLHSGDKEYNELNK